MTASSSFNPSITAIVVSSQGLSMFSRTFYLIGTSMEINHTCSRFSACTPHAIYPKVPYWDLPDFAQMVYLTLQAVLGLETL